MLRDINLTVPEGHTVALVGQSGSGKSTLADLIPRFWDVRQGCVRVHGHDVRNLRVADLRSLMGNVSQEAILFNDTFRANIAFGVEDATDEQIIEAAKIANAHDFIMASAQGYDTNIGDRTEARGQRGSARKHSTRGAEEPASSPRRIPRRSMTERAPAQYTWSASCAAAPPW